MQQEGTEKEQWKANRSKHSEALKVWRGQEEAWKARNAEVDKQYHVELELWGKETDVMWEKKKKPWWNKPTKGTQKHPIPKPKLQKNVQDGGESVPEMSSRSEASSSDSEWGLTICHSGCDTVQLTGFFWNSPLHNQPDLTLLKHHIALQDLNMLACTYTYTIEPCQKFVPVKVICITILNRSLSVQWTRW